MEISREQLEAIRLQMEEEHRRDIAALERIMSKFGVPTVGKEDSPQKSTAGNATVIQSIPADTIMATAQKIIRSAPGTVWTAQTLYCAMRAENYPFTQDEAGSTNVLSAVLGKLMRNGTLLLVAKGASRRPAQYRWKGTQNEEATEVAS